VDALMKLNPEDSAVKAATVSSDGLNPSMMVRSKTSKRSLQAAHAPVIKSPAHH
jgi:hypothetical protein